MRTVVLASVRTYARRYVAAVVAVVVGVSFVVVTASISSATKSGMLAALADSYPGAKVIVQDLGTSDAEPALTALEKYPTTVNASVFAPVAVNGTQVADDVHVGTISETASLRWQHLSAGHFPQAPGEAVVDARVAKENHVRLGDTITVGEPGTSVDATVVGTVRGSTGPLGAAAYLTWPGLRGLGDTAYVDEVVVGGSATAATVRSVVPKDAEVSSADTVLQARTKQLTRDVDAIAAMLLVFGAVALFVSTMVIANTFTVLLAQRLRDFALLRCVGASRKQVMRSVRQEALVIGVVSSTIGVVVGLVLGRLLVLLASKVLPALPTGDVHVGWAWLLGAWLVGVLVTLVASVFPARRSTRIDPLAALRPVGQVDVRSRSGVARLGLGVLLIVVGSGLLLLAVGSGDLLVMIAGGFASFFGVLLFGPVLVPACVRVVGLATARVFGVPGRLAAANAVRNPRRTAATAASLLVGTTLITAMVTGMSTIRGSLDDEMDAEYPLDAALVAPKSIADTTVAKVAALDGVQSARGIRGTTASIADLPVTVLATPGSTDLYRGDPEFRSPAKGTVYVPWKIMNNVQDPDHLALTVGGRTVDLHPVGSTGWGDALLVSPATLKSLGGTDATYAVWARATDGADADDLTSSFNTVAASVGATPTGGLKNRAYVDLQLDVMVYAVVTLLGVALVIALIGIGNTLGLSVLERRREHAMLRALGLTRGQLRATLAVEAVLLAVVTSVIGIVLGAIYALVAVKTILENALSQTGVHLGLPWAQLLLVVLVAGLAGLAACVLPARQAARITPAAGLALD